MKKLYILIVTSIALALSLTSFAQTTTPDFIKNDLDAYIEQALKDWNVPGVAIAIVKDGEVILTKGYGKIDMNSRKKVDENTLFMIASNTKAFVGTSLAYLEYDGKCDLNDSVRKWVPDFNMYDPALTSQVTITDVLSHRIGLQTFQGDFMYFYSSLSKKQAYQKFPLVKPSNSFRTQYGYCNMGYFWAGECIQGISGMTWDKYLQNKYFL